MEEEMNYFENIEGLLEPTEDNIEGIEKKTEKSRNDSEDNDKEESFQKKLSSLSQDDAIETINLQLKSLDAIIKLQALGVDVSEALGMLKERLNACLEVTSNKEVKREILTAMKKAYGSTEELEAETSKHR